MRLTLTKGLTRLTSETCEPGVRFVRSTYIYIAMNMSNPKSFLLCMAVLLPPILTHAQKPIGAAATGGAEVQDNRKQTNEPTNLQALSEEIKELKTQLDVLR